MARRTSYRYILFIFIIAGGMHFVRIASAQDKIQENIKESIKEEAMNGVISRPVVEYKSGQLRDPFRPLKVIKGKKATAEEKKVDLMKAGSDLGNLKVQGIIWGGRFPQAIINERVLTVGDTIDGVEILSIGKDGITLSSGGGADNLTVSVEPPAFKTGE